MSHDRFGNLIPDDPHDYVPQFQASLGERAKFHAWILVMCLLTGFLGVLAYSYLR